MEDNIVIEEIVCKSPADAISVISFILQAIALASKENRHVRLKASSGKEYLIVPARLIQYVKENCEVTEPKNGQPRSQATGLAARSDTK